MESDVAQEQSKRHHAARETDRHHKSDERLSDNIRPSGSRHSQIKRADEQEIESYVDYDADQ